MKTIENEWLKVSVNDHGAELCSVVRKSDGREMLWQADPKFWKRHSPVLFPIVGSLWEKRMRYEGVTYEMGQHGLARDLDFTPIAESASELRYRLVSTDATREHYPFDFVLEIGYRLEGNKVTVIWHVENPSSDKDMHFQIGAHPAFFYSDYDENAAVQGYFQLEPKCDELSITMIGEKGCVREGRENYSAKDGLIAIDKQTFNGDALVFEDSQVKAVSLLDAEKKPYLRMEFEAPVVGLWSPLKDAYAPFVCIEPWYGRCDRERYEGDFAQKDWMNHLKAGEHFDANYVIEIL